MCLSRPSHSDPRPSWPSPEHLWSRVMRGFQAHFLLFPLPPSPLLPSSFRPHLPPHPLLPLSLLVLFSSSQHLSKTLSRISTLVSDVTQRLRAACIPSLSPPAVFLLPSLTHTQTLQGSLPCWSSAWTQLEPSPLHKGILIVTLVRLGSLAELGGALHGASSALGLRGLSSCSYGLGDDLRQKLLRLVSVLKSLVF